MVSLSSSPSLLVIWHSRTGASKNMALEAADAARAEIEVTCLNATAASPDHLLKASAYIFACPENLGSMSGAMKEFFDRSYYPVLGKIEGRAYASIVAAGSDGAGAQRQIDRIATGWRLRRVVEPLIVNFSAQDPETIMAPKEVPGRHLKSCREIGLTLAAGTAVGLF